MLAMMPPAPTTAAPTNRAANSQRLIRIATSPPVGRAAFLDLHVGVRSCEGSGCPRRSSIKKSSPYPPVLAGVGPHYHGPPRSNAAALTWQTDRQEYTSTHLSATASVIAFALPKLKHSVELKIRSS